MPLTVNVLQRNSLGSQTKTAGTLAFDASYPTGGETITAGLLGLSRLDEFEIKSVEAGRLFEVSVDQNVATIQVFEGGSAGHTPAGTVSTPTFTSGPLPPHTHNLPPFSDEIVAVAGNTGTLAQLPAAITYVYASVGAAVGPKQMISPSAAPAAGEVAVNILTGVLTFNAVDAVTQALVSYIASNSIVAITAGTPSGTIGTPIFTGTPVPGGAAGEVANGTDLTALNSVEFEAVGS